MFGDSPRIRAAYAACLGAFGLAVVVAFLGAHGTRLAACLVGSVAAFAAGVIDPDAPDARRPVLRKGHARPDEGHPVTDSTPTPAAAPAPVNRRRRTP